MNDIMQVDLSRNVSIDIETLGTEAGCVILAVGACTLDEQKKFSCLIDPADSRLRGFTENIDTLRWWNKQDPALKNRMMSGVTTVGQALINLSDWIKTVDQDNKRTYFWAKGSNFDFPILETAYKRMNIPIPWHYRNIRDLRTLASLLPHVKADPIAVAHDPLEDAIGQARHIVKLFQVL